MSTVTVGCKLPNGVIMEMGTLGTPEYRRVTLKGANSATVVGGYGLTEHVDEALFDAWVKKNSWLEFIKQGLVFKQARADDARAQAADTAEMRSGFERLAPKDFPKGVEPLADRDDA